MPLSSLASGLTAAVACLGFCAGVVAWDGQDTQDPPPSREEPFSLEDALGSPGEADSGGEASLFDQLGENLRLNFDFVSRFEITSRREELALLNAAGLDIHKVFSDERGDIGTLLLQPYIVRRDNLYSRLIERNHDDAFVFELHDFYFNLTRFGRGRSNIKAGHFDVPFGLEPLVDTHFTLRQLTAMHDAGFKKDWGASLNGAMPRFDYEVSLTRGTGMDLNDRGHDTYLFAGRIGTPSDQNLVLGLSALYGEVHDRHGTHRVDEGDPRGEGFREADEWIRRWRVGADATQVLAQFTLRSQIATGEDFGQEVLNALAEIVWTTPEEDFSIYLQGVYFGQNGFLGWSEDVMSRLGLVWQITEQFSLSAQWTHEFDKFAREEGGPHTPEDTYELQFRLRF